MFKKCSYLPFMFGVFMCIASHFSFDWGVYVSAEEIPARDLQLAIDLAKLSEASYQSTRMESFGDDARGLWQWKEAGYMPSGLNWTLFERKTAIGKIERVIADGYQIIEATTPALITVSNELGEARYATLKGIMAAAKKQPTIWKPADIGVDAGQIGVAGRKNKLVKLFQPVKEGKCEVIEADSPAEAGAKLALKLRESKLL